MSGQIARIIEVMNEDVLGISFGVIKVREFSVRARGSVMERCVYSSCIDVGLMIECEA
jgi:hypothetical protein